MAAEAVGWMRWIWHALAVVLPVGVAVATNQILTDGRWSWWWTGSAVALAAAGTLVTYRLTRQSAAESGATPGASRQGVQDSTTGRHIDQVRDVTGDLRLRDLSAVTPPPPVPRKPDQAVPHAPAATPAAARAERDSRPPASESGQQVSRSQASGSITQIDRIGGDVTIERT
ncbi:hypothetical protein ACQEVF_57150 [Nonomuraea polychroma]|uniref:hypothetical protein n=1 Tax=Nonomuraea polychroma TaxID=46176 RepID=UPI003D93AB2C